MHLLYWNSSVPDAALGCVVHIAEMNGFLLSHCILHDEGAAAEGRETQSSPSSSGSDGITKKSSTFPCTKLQRYFKQRDQNHLLMNLDPRGL
jgi:hypothetical protein